jgi:hypothetical protein
MFVYLRSEVLVEGWDESPKSRAPDEPLEVRSTGMVVGAVEPGAGDDLEESSEERFVPGMHPNRYGWLAAVTAEAPLPDQYADEQADLESLRCKSPLSSCGSCYTVW